MWILPRPGLIVGWWVEGMWQTCSGHQVKWFPYCQVGNCPFLPLRTEMGTCEATSARLVQSTWDCEEHRFYLRAVEKGCGSFSGSARPLLTWTTACEKERLTSKTWRCGYQRISIFQWMQSLSFTANRFGVDYRLGFLFKFSNMNFDVFVKICHINVSTQWFKTGASWGFVAAIEVAYSVATACTEW